MSKMTDECEFYKWSLGINENNAVVMSWCEHPNEGEVIGYDAEAEGFRKLAKMFDAAAERIEKAEKKAAKAAKAKVVKKPKQKNLNPKCNEYDDEGRCEQCGQFDCYECDWD
jgi:hypothetical protein